MLREVLLTFITAKFGNAAGTTAFQILLFCIIWRRQKGAQTFHVSAENYQKSDFLDFSLFFVVCTRLKMHMIR